MQQHNGFEQALNQYYDQWLATLPDESDPAIQHTFSRRYKRKMRRLVAMQPKAYFPMVSRTWKRALLAAAIALLLFLAAMSVGAVRESVIHFFVEVYELFSTLIPRDDPDTGVGDGVYVITELPEGFELHSSVRFDRYARHEYLHPNGNYLVLQQYDPGTSQVKIDTENVSLEEITLIGGTGYYYINKGHGNLVWYDSGCAFNLIGDFDKESLIKIALSVQIQ